MTTQPSSASANAARPKAMPRGLYLAAVGAMVVGGLGAAFQIYDMAFPSAFVGDMYGLIVLMRLIPLGGCLLALLVGGFLSVLGWTRRRRGLCIAGAVVAIGAAVLIVAMGVWTAWERYDDAPTPKGHAVSSGHLPAPRPKADPTGQSESERPLAHCIPVCLPAQWPFPV